MNEVFDGHVEPLGQEEERPERRVAALAALKLPEEPEGDDLGGGLFLRQPRRESGSPDVRTDELDEAVEIHRWPSRDICRLL